MERTTPEFGGHLIGNSKLPMIPRSLIVQVQMQSIQSRDVASVFILGKDYYGTFVKHLMLDRGKSVQHYKHIVIEYSHVHLKITI